MKPLKMGYVGCGFMAQKVHIPNMLLLEECNLTALAEARPEAGRRVAERFNIPTLYQDHSQLGADSDVEAVAVSGHYSGQGEIAVDLLKAGKDVFMEKPMAVSRNQAERILAAEKESGRRLMVAYMKRYDAGNMLVRKLIGDLRASGELGEVTFVRNHGFCGDWTAGLDTPFITTDEPYPPADPILPEWLPGTKQNGYLGYLQQYTHNINLVRWFLDAGADIELRAVDLDPDNGMRGVVLFEAGGVRAVIESGGVAYHGWDEHTAVYFEKGWVQTWAPPLLQRNATARVELYRGDTHTRSELFPEDGWSWSYKEEIRHFAQAIRSGEPFRSPASDAGVDVAFFEDVYIEHLKKQNECDPC